MHVLLESWLVQLAFVMVAIWALLAAIEVGLRLYDRHTDTHEITTDELARAHLQLNNRIRELERRMAQLIEARRRPPKLPISPSLN